MYGFVLSNAINTIDFFGMIDFDTAKLVTPEKVKIDWDSDTMNINQMGRTVPYYAVVSFTCQDGKIIGDITGDSHIYLNWNVTVPTDRNGKNDTWERVMGHEQRHVKSMYDLIMQVVQEIKNLPDTPADDESVKDLIEKYQAEINKKIIEGTGHSDDQKNPRPADGIGYNPLPGSGPVPPKPEQDPTANPPPPLRPLPDFNKK